jgi:predicted N-acyltransferase
MNVRFIDNIHLIPAEAWHTLVGSDYPFLRHEFLAALEASHSVGGQSGWQPMHLVVESDDGRLLAAMPLVFKKPFLRRICV